MSVNQSKSHKNEFQHRKPGGGGRSGSSGQQRTFTGGRGGGSTAPPPVSNPSYVSATRSLKKTHNAQGVQTRVVAGAVNAGGAAPAPAQNGSHSQSTHAAPATTSRPNDMATQRNTAPIPKAPSSQSSAVTSNSTSTTPTPPSKGDGAKGFSLQFGSLGAGFMNGMQVPARTTSAPPNIDELKRDQAQHAALKGASPIPLASVPKPLLPRKDIASVPQHTTGESNAESRVKRDSPVMPASQKSQQQKPAVVPLPGISIQVPYPQSSIPLQFGGPNPQMQSQGMPTSSHPMPMQIQLQIGNPSQVPQQMFMPGLQHHIIQPQGIMHQTQNLGFNPQMNQLPHQLGSPGMSLPAQFSPQQPVNYNNMRKAVKITHPETHEELRLDKKIDVHPDGTSSSRTQLNGPPQPFQPSQPMGYYPNSYPAAPKFFPATSSSGVPSAQLNTLPQQASRFNYPPSQAPHTASFASRSAPVVSKGVSVANSPVESSSLDSSRVTVSSSPVVVTIKPAIIPSTGKSVDSKPVEKDEGPKTSGSAADVSIGLKPAVSHGKSSITVNNDGGIKVTVARPESVKEIQKKPVTGGDDQLLPQLGAQDSASLSEPVERDDPLKMLASLPVRANKDISGSSAGRGMGQTQLEQSSAVRDASSNDGVDHAAKQQDPPQAETSSTGEHGGNITLDVEKQKHATLVVDSLKPEEIVEESNLNVELQGNNYRLGVVGRSVVHTQSSTSHAVGNGIDKKTSFSDDRVTMKASDYISGSEAVAELQSSGHEDDATIVHVKFDEGSSRPEKEITEIARPTSSSGSVSSLNKASVESSKTRTTSARGKKNLKQILQKADAQGASSDLYMAYKGPNEKKEMSSSVESSEDTLNNELQPVSHELNQDSSLEEKDVCSKAEPDDWEDAADVSTPKLQSLSDMTEGQDGEDAGTAKKYSRDFLLTFSEQYTNLPEGFEINSDTQDILARPSSSSSSRAMDREHPSPGRIVDRPSSGHKVDRRGSGIVDADRWNKHQGSFPVSREMGLDLGHGSTQIGFRPGQGGNHGVLRNPPRGQPHVQHPILSGPMHSAQRNNADGDRWRNANYKGLMPSPQTHMHRAEKKYEVGKVTDEEQAKQRKLKGILNKLTPQNFDKLFAQVKEVNIDNVITLTGVISQIFDKALMEPTFCEMYSNFCYQLSLALPDLSVDDEKVTFKRLLLNKCQEEFERGEREEEEANKDDSEEEIKLSDGEREERRIKARRRMLGNIRLIGELYKKKMLTERIMHECIKKLLSQFPNCVEEDIESLCKLMSTIGESIDHPRGKDLLDMYFGYMFKLSNDMKLSSRVRFMLKDAIDLRKNKWQERRKVEGPKKIEDVHRDAAQERQAQATRLNRGPSMGSGMRRGQPVDYAPRGSGMLSSPVGQAGSFRGLPQGRGYAMQDARMDDRNSFNSRTISMPLPSKPLGDDSITLGPQGGLARGMSIRGQPSLSTAPLADNSLSHGDTRRNGGSNGFSSMQDRASFNSRGESLHRYTPPERPQSSGHDHSATIVNRDHKNMDRNLDRSHAASLPSRGHGILTGPNTSSDQARSEEHLRDKSIAAIREFYSAKDEKEVDTCVRDLNNRQFYSSVISTWVTDSFERKDMERDMLNKLIVNLSKNRDGQLFTPDQLIKGFETVLTNLEESVSDAPKAPDYLGRLLASLILENTVSLQAIAGLLYEGGEEPGRLREEGLAGDVLVSILEKIKSEKGEKTVKEMCVSSKLRLEDFRPPDPLKSKKLELFI